MTWAQRCPSLRRILMMRWMTMMVMIWMMVPYLEECQAASLPSPDQAVDSPPSGSGQVAPAVAADPELEGAPGSPSGSSGEVGPPVEEGEPATDDRREEDANSLPTTETFSGDVLAQDDVTGQQSETVTPSKKEEATGYPVTENLVDDASSAKEKVSKSRPAAMTVSRGPTTTPTTRPESTPHGTSYNAEKNEPEVSEGYSETPDIGKNSDDDSTEDDTLKKNETTTERSPRVTPSRDAETPSSPVATESSAAVTEDQTFRTVQPGTTPQSPPSSAEESVTSPNTPGPESSDEASLTNASSAETKETLVTLQNETPSITNAYTFSKPPSDELTTAEDIFTKEMESSERVKTGPGFKVTSDQLFVSGSGKPSRRHTRSTNGLTQQHTPADVSSTVPSNAADSTSVEMSSTVRSSGSGSDTTSEHMSTVTMPTTSVTSELPETSTAARLGMKCSSSESCAEVGSHTTCVQGVCRCQSGYHGDVLNNACIREPHLLTAEEDGNTCVNITWQGGDDEYNVTVTSVPDDKNRSERMRNTWGVFCNFSPGSNVTVSVTLSSGGSSATSWVVLEPSSAENVEISSVNETCVTATWQGGVGYTQYYNLTMRVLVSSQFNVVSESTADSQWTRCNLEPGSKFSLQVQAFSHGKNSEQSAFLNNDTDSTAPSQPREGRAEGSPADPRRCVSLQWMPGPGFRDHFYIPGHLDETQDPTATVCGLQPGSRHSFPIFAFSDPRSSKPLVLEACTDPNKVQNLRVVQIDATWVSLTWDSPSKGNADRYIIKGNNSDEPLVTDRTTATVVGLSSGTTYTVSVEAEFCNRTSRPSPVTFTTKFSVLTSVNVSARGTVLEVFWESDQKKEVPVELIVKHKERTVFKEVVHTSPRMVQTNSSGACFNVSLRVVNSSQVQTTVQATEPAAPEEVQYLQAQRLTNERRSVSVTWWPPAVANGVVAFYNVSVRGLRGLRQTSRRQDCQRDCSLDCHAPEQMMADAYLPSADTAANYSVVIDELSEYENYNVTVTAFTSAGEGLPSSVRVEGQLLDSVSRLKVEELNATCLRLTWSSPANADADAQAIHYLLEYQEAAADEQARTRFEKNVTDTRCLLCGLQFWTDYRVNVTAVNGEGPGRTDTRLRRTAEHVPGVVSNVTVSPETSIHKPRRLEVTWSAPVHPYGIIRSYFVTVRDRDTKEVVERRRTPQSRQKRAVDGGTFKETFGLIGDHHYHVEVFGATGAGNGSQEHREVTMPAGVLPPSGETVHFNPDTIEVTSLLVDIPASLLCNFTYGLPVHAGYIVYRLGQTPSGISQGTSLGPRPVVSTPWAPAHTPFFVQMDVRTQCAGVAAHGKYLSVRVGHKECGKETEGKGGGGGSGARRPSSPNPGTCGGPLEPHSRYHVLVVFCTSAACRYTLPAPAFTTRPQPEDTSSDTAGLAAGLTVVFLLLLLGGPAAFYWVYRKKQAKSGPVILPQPTQDTECREIICRSRPVALDVFVDHVQLLHRDSNLGFSDEYKTIKDHAPYYSVRASELPPCKPKNRYMNILPWDQSRVKLIPTDDEEGSDYINANYLPGENHQREFIAAQGPLPGTVDDFWRMVWENRVCVMVMLTQCIEKGKTKCERYWPDEGVQTIYGDLVVQVRSQSVLPDYIIRVIDIKLGSQSRMIKHFHFMRWPDHGCPERTSMLLNFVSSVRAHMPHSGAGPTLVHCSAGVGRTGTFIALDRLLLQIRQNSQVDIFGLVFQMREHRMQMVQTENQYVYIHDCLADALTKDKESDDDQSDSEEEHIYGNC